jgi:ectoine hydroxylase-related dioxygenase (phytanoyl-CoA dioxygenase family)
MGMRRTNCVIALVDFDEQNGPTRYVRGSHLRPHVTSFGKSKGPSKEGSTQHIQDGDSGEDEEIFACKAGSALLYDNRLVHGRGPNRSPDPRYTMSLFCCRSWVSHCSLQ